jgi:hypothetical protein
MDSTGKRVAPITAKRPYQPAFKVLSLGVIQKFLSVGNLANVIGYTVLGEEMGGDVKTMKIY